MNYINVQTGVEYGFDAEHDDIRKQRRVKVIKTCVNVNSASRRVEPQIVRSQTTTLAPDAFSFKTDITESSFATVLTQHATTTYYYYLKVRIPGHRFVIGNKFSINSLRAHTQSLRVQAIDVNPVILTSGSASITIVCNPLMQLLSPISYDDLKRYDTASLRVTVSGFAATSHMIGNIPTNVLNARHRIYLSNPDESAGDTIINVPDADGFVHAITGFYVLLDRAFIADGEPFQECIVNLSFNHIGGVTLASINTDISSDVFHSVSRVTRNAVYTQIHAQPLFTDRFGGDDIAVSNIESINLGFSSPSKYEVALPKYIRNIIRARLVSSVFPNNAAAFNITNDDNDNAISWQNESDGDMTYTARIATGMYTRESLVQALSHALNSVQRIEIPDSDYTRDSIFLISIDRLQPLSNVISLLSFRKANLVTPIIHYESDTRELMIQLHGHALLVTDEVAFDGFLASHGIPARTLNTSHTVTSVVTNDAFIVTLPPFNPDTDTTVTNGGNECVVTSPNRFRITASQTTPASLSLASRHVLQVLDNNVVTRGYTYILMKVEHLNKNINVTKVKAIADCFAIINLPGDRSESTMLYDTFARDMGVVLQIPIDLSVLSVSFYSPDGSLYSFGGVEHSFVVEFTSVDYVPIGTEMLTDRPN